MKDVVEGQCFEEQEFSVSVPKKISLGPTLFIFLLKICLGKSLDHWQTPIQMILQFMVTPPISQIIRSCQRISPSDDSSPNKP